MRTSHRVFAAALSSLLLGALIAIVPFAPKAQALNGVHTMSIDNASCPEQTATCTITVRVSPANNIPFDDMSASVSTVDISAVGTGAFKDYTATTANVNFNGGAQTATFNVPIINDTFREPSEQFTFKFNSVNGATAGSVGTATITDNEVGNIPTFTIEGSGSAAEGNADNVRPVKV